VAVTLAFDELILVVKS